MSRDPVAPFRGVVVAARIRYSFRGTGSPDVAWKGSDGGVGSPRHQPRERPMATMSKAASRSFDQPDENWTEDGCTIVQFDEFDSAARRFGV